MYMTDDRQAHINQFLAMVEAKFVCVCVCVYYGTQSF